MNAPLTPLPPHPRMLVIVMRRLGDVLVTTPLIHRLRVGRPGACIDVLVLAGTQGMLTGNPDIDEVIAVAPQPSAVETCRLVARLWRRYDVAVSTQTGDRPTFLAFVAGRWRIGLAPARGGGAWWKRRLLDQAVTIDPGNHRVIELMRLAAALGAAGTSQPVVPGSAAAPSSVPGALRRPYAVLHPNPMYRYKRWNVAGWRDVARGLAARGLAVVVTQGRDAEEQAYVDQLFQDDASIVREGGRLDWAGLTVLLKGAAVYIGPDTSVTHLAAGSGCPTVALYGPTSPCLVGPWPVGGLDRPWAPSGRLQRRGNVWLVQNPLPCLPCEKLGCDGHLDSRSQCLDELGADQVLTAVDQALLTREAVLA
jgi:lipopolysaccharide heptosyltransferase III